MSLLDARVSAALRDQSRASLLLQELHQQILTCRDPRSLSELLGKYGATAVGSLMQRTVVKVPRRMPASKPGATDLQMETRMAQTISNVSKTYHDLANNTITNLKA